MADAEKYYIAQKKVRDNDTIDPERVKHSLTWLEDDTVDAYRHRRMYSYLDPFLNCFPDASWLTVGDGRLASDARYIRQKIRDVTATDISEGLLIKAKEMGLIEKFSVENAEKLSFPNGSFDFVFCKEAYHHFPRPMMALYEMLRVARRAVLLMEPKDQIFDRDNIGLLEIVKALLKKTPIAKVIGKKIEPSVFSDASYEQSGNYVYSISKRELVKVALGIGLPSVAFAGMNDYYEKGVEFEKATEESKLFRKVRKKISQRDRSGISSLMIAAVFKEKPTEELSNLLTQQGYRVCELPKNPYL